MEDNHRKKKSAAEPGVTRRHFLTGTGLGAVGLAAGVPAVEGDTKTDSAAVIEAGQTVPVTLRINGVRKRLLVEPRWSLAYVL
ncbi:MAG: twin-arginine translocation signal domain-containing protein, partial [Thermoanaerobaculia bacterium]